MMSVTSVAEDIRVLTHKMTSQKGDFRKNEAIALWRFNTLYFRLLNAAFSFHLFFLLLRHFISLKEDQSFFVAIYLLLRYFWKAFQKQQCNTDFFTAFF